MNYKMILTAFVLMAVGLGVMSLADRGQKPLSPEAIEKAEALCKAGGGTPAPWPGGKHVFKIECSLPEGTQ